MCLYVGTWRYFTFKCVCLNKSAILLPPSNAFTLKGGKKKKKKEQNRIQLNSETGIKIDHEIFSLT